VNCNELPVSLVEAATVDDAPPKGPVVEVPATVFRESPASKFRNKGVASAACAGAIPVAIRDPVASSSASRLPALRSVDLGRNMSAFHFGINMPSTGKWRYFIECAHTHL
jgi:hypothetical protein